MKITAYIKLQLDRYFLSSMVNSEPKRDLERGESSGGNTINDPAELRLL